jgi:hypothetical protein
MPGDEMILLGSICPNSWVDSRLEVRASTIHGRGLFASAPVHEGEAVIIWGGAMFTEHEILAGRAAEHSYAALRVGLFLGHPAEHGNSADDFMNHSCDPNLWMVNEVTWVARRNIATGEEVTGDCAMYWGLDGEGPAAWDCHCLSPLCRQRFTTDDWQRPDLQARYGNHFAPYINEQIRQFYECAHGQAGEANGSGIACTSKS